MYAKVNSLGIFGTESYAVEVEADLSSWLPRFDIVGLPDLAVKESKDRVRSSIKNCHLEYPTSRITVNIAPADVKKEGSVYDLPIFITLLKATNQMRANINDYAFIGELSLDGEIRKVKGCLPMVIKAKEMGLMGVFIPFDNREEGSVIEGIDVYPAKNVKEILAHLGGEKTIAPVYNTIEFEEKQTEELDFADVKGQEDAKRALEIAAAGGHNSIMIGPPGTGKSMLAKRIVSILPEMSFEEKIEATKIYSIAGELPSGVGLIEKRPFRSPHHTISPQGLTGGGKVIRPGEISFAHNGVMFMDEFPEFDRRAKEALRQPLEDGIVTISRTMGTVTFPSNMMLIAAMNPCPCGYLGHPTRKCTCTSAAKRNYKDRISGPLLDRIDIHIELQSVDFDKLSSTKKEESSAEIRKRVNEARNIQRKRFEGTSIKCNADMTPKMTKESCILSDDAKALLKVSFEKMGMSARAYDKILRVSRTIADLANSKDIELEHIAEALQYRVLDRKYSEGE